jgi:hypothetical protein
MTVLLNIAAFENPCSIMETKVPQFRKALAQTWAIRPKEVDLKWTSVQENPKPYFLVDPQETREQRETFEMKKKQIESCWAEVWEEECEKALAEVGAEGL